jgi:uncharacterized membrane protein HdeD (DUF308 family)
MTATTMETQQRPWWTLLVGGIIAVIVGAVLLWSPAKTAANAWLLLTAMLGIYWLVLGILDLVSMFQDHTAWGWKLFIGIVSILAGLVILMYPVAAAVALPRIFTLVLGIWGLIYGVVLLIMAFQGGGWGAGVLGVLAIILGVALIANWTSPGIGLAFIWASAVCLLIGGVILIVRSFQQRSA